MKQVFTAVVWREGDWFAAQCLEVDVASQGRTEETEEEALKNLREALELYKPLTVACRVTWRSASVAKTRIGHPTWR